MKITVIKVTKRYYYQEADSAQESLDQIRIYGKNPDLVEFHTQFVFDKHVRADKQS